MTCARGLPAPCTLHTVLVPQVLDYPSVPSLRTDRQQRGRFSTLRSNEEKQQWLLEKTVASSLRATTVDGFLLVQEVIPPVELLARRDCYRKRYRWTRERVSAAAVPYHEAGGSTLCEETDKTNAIVDVHRATRTHTALAEGIEAGRLAKF